jgi:hypothetical protein
MALNPQNTALSKKGCFSNRSRIEKITTGFALPLSVAGALAESNVVSTLRRQIAVRNFSDARTRLPAGVAN